MFPKDQERPQTPKQKVEDARRRPSGLEVGILHRRERSMKELSPAFQVNALEFKSKVRTLRKHGRRIRSQVSKQLSEYIKDLDLKQESLQNFQCLQENVQSMRTKMKIRKYCDNRSKKRLKLMDEIDSKKDKRKKDYDVSDEETQEKQEAR